MNPASIDDGPLPSSAKYAKYLSPILSKRVFRWGGGVLSVVALAFVALRVLSFVEQLDLGAFRVSQWLTLAAFSFAYAIASVLLTGAWRQILLHLGEIVEWKTALRTYGISQIAKYVPGNVFQFVSRQLLGLSRSLGGGALAKSVIFELGTMSVTGAWLGLWSLPLLFDSLPPWSGGALSAGTFLIGTAVVHRHFGMSLLRAALHYALFLAIAGGLFAAIIGLVASTGVLQPRLLPGLVAAYVVAWLAGLLTPGAPAGIGIREFVLLLFLEGIIAEADLLLAVLLHRAVTLVGDLGFFGLASLIPAPTQTAAD